MKESLKRKSVFTVKAMIGLAIFCSISLAASGYGEQLRQLKNTNWTILGLGLFFCLFYRLANANGWSYVLESLSTPLPRLVALRIWLTSEACRWLPGSVWSYGSRAMKAKKHGVPAVAAGSSLLLEMLLTIGAWVFTAVVCLISFGDSFAALLSIVPLKFVFVFATVISLAGVVAMAAAKKKAGFGENGFMAKKLARLQTQFTSLKQTKINYFGVSFAFGYFCVMCFVNGIAAYFVFRAVLPNSDLPLFAVIGANAAAWLVGFFAILAPGGLVVREGTMATMLVAWLPMEQAIAAAVVWRAIQIVVEIACMIPAYAPKLWTSSLPRTTANLV